jgi:acetyltransferase
MESDTAAQPARSANQQSTSRQEKLPRRAAALDTMFNPATVAVIGASERPGSVGQKTLAALQAGQFTGKLFAVNPARASILGIAAYAHIADMPGPVDLAVIVTPAETVPGIIAECVQAKVKSAVVISGGSTGAAGAALEQQIREHLRGSRMRVIGPDCLGILVPGKCLNTSFALRMPLGGNIAFLSQSGALCTSILDWSVREIVGFSAFVSVGEMLDVDWGDMIDHFGRDPETQSIIIYMESLGDARSFLSAAREVALSKPIIVVKAGRTEAGSAAVARHTGCDAGQDEVLEAAFRRVGVLRVNEIAEIFSIADALSKQPRPQGPRMVVVSNVTSPSVLAADAVINTGGELADLSDDTYGKLQQVSPRANRANPVVVLGAGPQGYVEAVEIAAKDPNCDGLLAIMVPQAMPQSTKAAELLVGCDKSARKPLLACFMGETAGPAEMLTRACIPTFAFPDAAVRAFNQMWQYSYNLRALYETPALRADATAHSLRTLAQGIIRQARDAGRAELSEAESKQLLAAYDIPAVETRIAHNEQDARRIAGEIGFPVTLEVVSGANVGAGAGFRFTLPDGQAVHSAWHSIAGGGGKELAVALRAAMPPGFELRLGSRIDPQFGPVLLFGVGGSSADYSADRTVGLPPLNATLAERMMERTRVFRVLKNRTSRSVVELTRVLVRLSQLVIEQSWIKEIEINPLLVTAERVAALEARVTLHSSDWTEDDLPRPAIRPYPTQYVSTWTMKNGETATFRPIRAEDEALMVKFHEELSDESVYLRYFQNINLSQRTQHERLTRICFIDYGREMALVAERRDPHTEARRIIALGSLNKVHGCDDGEAAVVITDDCQGRGLGSEMFRRLVKVARDEKLSRVVATTMLENKQMTAILKHLGFKVTVDYEDRVVMAEMAVT